MREPARPLSALLPELRELAISIAHYGRQERFSEEAQARQDYAGVLHDICQQRGLDPDQVHHPLLGPLAPGSRLPSLA